MSKVKINREDSNRILLTELLPYEVPMLFSNDGFYNIVASGNFNYFKNRIKGARRNRVEYGIPFNFEVKKALLGETRLLSVIHPIQQIEFIDFYKKYDALIVHQCSKSPFSLRKISKIARFYYSPNLVFEEDEHKNPEVEVEPDVLDRETRLLKSYFTYRPIDLIYKFYESKDYQRLEQRYDLLKEFDISKCFYNIYTHSIAWAVKDKETAKRHTSQKSFENDFDTLMQRANWNETNGIVVGPEVSRIFAEIILQQIDLNVLWYLESRGLKFGVDYEVRRYVDDYFIFANDERHLETIFKSFKKELNEFKLYVNDAKTKQRVTPFITDQAVGKRELDIALKELYSKLIIETETPTEGDDDAVTITRQINSFRKPSAIVDSFIKNFQCIVKRNDLAYDNLSKDVVRFCKRTLVKIFKDKKLISDIEKFDKLLAIILDIAFYAYSLNITSSTTFKLAQIIVIICKFLQGKPEHIRQNIFSKISRETDFVMTIFQRKSKKDETNIETLNLLIAIKKLDDAYLISEKKLMELFSLEEKEEATFYKFNYFHIVTLLYYIGDKTGYEIIKEGLLSAIKYKFANEIDPFTKTEHTLLFFDIINCPDIEDKFKRQLMVDCHYANAANAQAEVDKIAKYKHWFMDWDQEIDLERVLKKKEWGSSY